MKRLVVAIAVTTSALAGCTQTFDFAVTHSPVQSQTRDVIERQTGEVSPTTAALPGTSSGAAISLDSLSVPKLEPGAGSVVAVAIIGAVVLYGVRDALYGDATGGAR